MTNPGVLTQVLDLQELMVKRGELHAVEHDVRDARVCADGDILVECLCGRGQFSVDEPTSYRRYALHVAQAIGLPMRRAVGR